RQRHHRAGARPGGGARRPRRPAGPEGRILPAVQRDVRTVVIYPTAKTGPFARAAGKGAGFRLRYFTSVKVSSGPGWYSRRPIISSRQRTGAWHVSWK